jgi:multicomponent Na+:H+ antiporter subunit E
MLAVVWLLLSGHYTTLILIFGAISCAFVTYLARRFDVVDHESHPLHMSWRLPGYWLWLLVEIVKANIDVGRRIIDPKLPIDPMLFEVDASQKTDLGRVIFANSITLTPGTVSVDMREGKILVHALTAEGAEDLRQGTMNAKATALEGNGA